MVLNLEDLRERLDASALEAQGDRYALRFMAMGTDCQVQFAAPSHGRAAAFRGQLFDWLAHFEARYSRFRPDSLISRINEAAGRSWVDVDPETEGLFQLCDWYHWITRGIFEPTALPLILLWDYRKVPFVPPTAPDIERARALLGWKRVLREPGRVLLPEAGMAIDLGGIGKEYAVDRTVEMAQAAGLGGILVDYGHDVRVQGEPPEGGPWRIGLEDPADPDRCWGGIAVRDRAVCSSGDYLRSVHHAGRTYGHILDPRTGYPVHGSCQSATVLAPTCTEAGILSTASFILGPEDGLALIDTHHQAEGCLCANKNRHFSRRFHEYLIQ